MKARKRAVRIQTVDFLLQRSLHSFQVLIWEFPRIRGTFLGVPIIRIIIYWGLYWGPLILGNYHISLLLTKLGGGVSI